MARADSAYYGWAIVGPRSATMRGFRDSAMTKTVTAAITYIGE